MQGATVPVFFTTASSDTLESEGSRWNSAKQRPEKDWDKTYSEIDCPSFPYLWWGGCACWRVSSGCCWVPPGGPRPWATRLAGSPSWQTDSAAPRSHRCRSRDRTFQPIRGQKSACAPPIRLRLLVGLTFHWYSSDHGTCLWCGYSTKLQWKMQQMFCKRVKNLHYCP